MTLRAAGIIYLADNRALFLKRATGDHCGEWCFPGGAVEGEETAAEAAKREFEEETGRKLDGDVQPWTRRVALDTWAPAAVSGPAAPNSPPLVPLDNPEPVDYTTFIFPGVESFEPKLNDEHCAYAWAPVDQPPEPLHPGCRVALAKFTADELGIARLIMQGDLVSPQHYKNVWLFDLRITGTGTAYRSTIDEHVYRPPAEYLNEQFLARCNGLPVIWEHPPKKKVTLDSGEFKKRIVGTVFLPYISQDEVRAVAKIFDEAAAQLMIEEQLSTSPAVVFAPDTNMKLTQEDGSILLIEGNPSLLDHIAICERGVWDKGEEPSGVRADADFREADHPRDQEGKFSSSGGAGKASKGEHQTTRVSEGTRVTASGEALPPHIQALKIPPAWTDVTFSPDPKSDLLATGKDSKGRRQAVYSAEFSAKQAAAKFARINELNQKFDDIFAQNEKARKSDEPKKRAAADCVMLIMTTGIRPGSEDDTGAEKKAYGATTLEGRHVVVDGDSVSLRFVGKKGVSLDIAVTDKGTAEMLKARKEAAGDDGQLFDINEKTLLDHVHSFDGGGFKTKDFRTLLGTRTAMAEVAKQAAPKTEKEYKKAVMSVAKIVSSKLGNTPAIALAAYINPVVFAEWRMAA